MLALIVFLSLPIAFIYIVKWTLKKGNKFCICNNNRFLGWIGANGYIPDWNFCFFLIKNYMWIWCISDGVVNMLHSFQEIVNICQSNLKFHTQFFLSSSVWLVTDKSDCSNINNNNIHWLCFITVFWIIFFNEVCKQKKCIVKVYFSQPPS